MDEQVVEISLVGCIGCTSILLSLIPFGVIVWAVIYIVDALK